ncbi:hypothetical protein EWM64_g8568 [Hericium alpestre]|uniref:DUF6593 domain-containing protein n=1 Tax=Hericium alpestre TaxID=135208 RepID=A0A4Y9ZLE7_9AGAM|nr:hypothetical protein EWM64_g8568 [Hericium alpestre]
MAQLKRDDRTKTHVAQYHPHSGVFSKGRSPHLEVSSHGLAILDEIVVTFVYMERRRKQNETEAAVAVS